MIDLREIQLCACVLVEKQVLERIRLRELHRRAGSPRDARGRVLVLQALCFRTVGTSIQGHDVSRTGWQTVKRAIESITTMTPVRQCGHSRNDRPVNAWKRSR